MFLYPLPPDISKTHCQKQASQNTKQSFCNATLSSFHFFLIKNETKNQGCDQFWRAIKPATGIHQGIICVISGIDLKYWK
ncbi:hypothetical protein [Persicobacter diffluens]|uniref:hypothetical protein n=1 Tax=Persicobacter diffluens TaxID=981 RepID=UPI0030C74DB2